MKTKRLLSVILVLSLVACGLSFGIVSAAEETPIYYPNGTVILSEEDFAADPAANFTVAVGDKESAKVEWNAETGRIRLTAGTKDLVVTLSQFPKTLHNYTITGKFIVFNVNSGGWTLVQLGTNYGGAWSTGQNMQVKQDGEVAFNNYKAPVGIKDTGSRNNKNLVPAFSADEPFEITFSISVTDTGLTASYNGIRYQSIPYSNLLETDALPYISLRSGCVMEVDDLMVYSGMGEPSALHAKDVQPSATLPSVYYPNGTVILDESMYKDHLRQYFSVASVSNTTSANATLSWDTANDRLSIKAGTNNGNVNIIGIPDGLTNYTVSADLYLTGENGSNANERLILGVNSGYKWSTGTYFEAQYSSSSQKLYFNPGGTGSYNIAGPAYALNTRIPVKIVVTEESVTMYGGESLTKIGTIAKEKLGSVSGTVFLGLRQNSTMAVDNLRIVAGTTDEEIAKTPVSTSPINDVTRPYIVGWQTDYNTATGDTYAVRVVASVKGTLGTDFSAVGFKNITVKTGSETKNKGDLYCAKVYTSLLGGGITYVPADTYGNYLFTFELAGIPKTVTELELGFNPFTATSETDFTMGGQVNFTVRVN